MEYKDYYQTLGLSRQAKPEEIKRAYRKLARKYHPDVSKAADAETRFKEIQEAYTVLKNPEKRQAYDHLGADWKTGQDFHAPPNWAQGSTYRSNPPGTGTGGFSDFFETLFGGGYRSGPRQSHHGHGEDIHTKIQIPLEDAYHGATRSLVLQIPKLDSQGIPRVRERHLNVHIPPGVRAGQHIRLTGQGGEGLGGGPRGDLYLEVLFMPHNLYRSEGRDVYLDLPITPWEAALGASVKAPTPGGVVDLKIPKNSGTGTKLRLKGRGIPGHPPGSLYVILRIVLPPADTDKARAIYRTMREELAFNPRAHMGV